MSDYYNLLQDSLRSGYLQVEKIFNRLQKMDSDLYVNVRTGYSMKYRSRDTNYVYSSGRYPLCWNSEAVSSDYNPITIERLLNKYEDWLDVYEASNDNEKIKRLIEKERKISRQEPDLDRKFNNTLFDFVEKYFENQEEQEEDEEEENSFIMKDDEVITSDGKKRRFFKKRLGKRPTYEDINSFSKIKKLRKRKFNYDSLYNDSIFDVKAQIEEEEDEEYENTEKFYETKRLRKNGRRIIKDEDEDEGV